MTRPAAQKALSALVIGAGLGGLAAAMRLGAKGYRVTVIDKLDMPGGCGTARVQDGHRFDLGPSIVTTPAVFRSLWGACGRDFDSEVELRQLDPSYEIRWPGGASFMAQPSAEATRKEVSRIAPGDLAGYDRLVRDSERRYRAFVETFGTHPIHRKQEMLKVLPTLAALRADRALYAHVARRIRDPRLRMAFSSHPLIVGCDPFRTSSMHLYLSHLTREYGVHYPLGGMGAVAKAMASVIRRQGGEFILGAEVDEIRLRGGRAEGVRLADGRILKSDIVVSNVDPHHTYGHLMRHQIRGRWTRERLARLRPTMGTFLWHFGTRGTRMRWPDVGHHTIVNGRTYKGLMEEVSRGGQLPLETSFILHRPTATDPSAAPRGDDTFCAMAPAPNLDFDNPVDWKRQAETYRRKIATMLGQIIPGFQNAVTASLVFTPEHFRDRYNYLHGAGFSLAPDFLQSGWFRPHIASEEAEGLYLVGAGTQPGAGVTGVLRSAEMLAGLVPDASDPMMGIAAE